MRLSLEPVSAQIDPSFSIKERELNNDGVALPRTLKVDWQSPLSTDKVLVYFVAWFSSSKKVNPFQSSREPYGGPY